VANSPRFGLSHHFINEFYHDCRVFFYDYEVILHTLQLHTSIAYNFRLTVLRTICNAFFPATALGISPPLKQSDGYTGIDLLMRHVELITEGRASDSIMLEKHLKI
jgi:hypothetical protein